MVEDHIAGTKGRITQVALVLVLKHLRAVASRSLGRLQALLEWRSAVDCEDLLAVVVRSHASKKAVIRSAQEKMDNVGTMVC